jgi:hypothetical protein
MDSYSYHITKWDPQPIVGGSWARVHPDPLNYNKSKRCGAENRMLNRVWTTALALDIISIVQISGNEILWIGGYTFKNP